MVRAEPVSNGCATPPFRMAALLGEADQRRSGTAQQDHLRRSPSRLLIVAAAGYGKTTALQEMAGVAGTYRHAADLVARRKEGDDVDGLRSEGEAAPVLLVDDACALAAPDQYRLLQFLDGLPASVRVVLAARRPLHPAARACLRGPVFERGPGDLALSQESVARVLAAEHGVDDAALAVEVYEATAGWPALVAFAGDVLARHRDHLLPALTEPGSPAATWVTDQVLGGLPAEVAAGLDLVADLDPVCDQLIHELAAAEPAAETDIYGWLWRTGLLVAHPRYRRAPAGGPARLVPVVAAVLRTRRTRRARLGEPAAVPDRLLTAADWYQRNGLAFPAAAALARAGRTPASDGLIEDRAEEMLAAGDAAAIVTLLASRPVAAFGPRLQRVRADALRMAGDVPAAQRAFGPLLDSARQAGTLDCGLAWRAAMVHYLRADYRAALDLLDAVPPGEEPLDRDCIEWLSCRTNALVMLGAAEHAASSAASCVARAELLGDDRAAAAAHLAAAKTSTGARKESHLGQALTAAERAGDVVQAARVLGNLAHGLLAQARYPEACDIAAQAVRAAERGSPPGILVTALHNWGEALARLGRYDDAALQFRRSVSVCRSLGLDRTAMGLWGLAEIYRQQGRREQSRAAFSEAVRMAQDSAEVQVLVPALAGLARVLLDPPTDAAAAAAAAEEAQRLAPPALAPVALAARGWVALAEGDRDLARERAQAAMEAARSGCAAAALADSSELVAAVATDPAQAAGALSEALRIWESGGAEPAADRIKVLLGQLPGAGGAARAEARDAGRRLMRLGVLAVNGLPLAEFQGAAATVDIRVLGGFEVRVGGKAVPLPAWRSRQARTLVKILVARRGRHITRSELCGLLWPDEDAARTAHRLSVLLSAVRAVLDPERTCPADHYIAADLSGLALNVKYVSIDVEHILQDAEHAASLLRSAERDRAFDVLAEVDAKYRGDAFPDEPYEEWADGLREEARAAWLYALRQLAKLRRSAGQHQDAHGLLVRLLVIDPYDEAAHRALVELLVRSRRHGEARRAFERWSGAMRLLDAPLPDPAVLCGGREPAGHPMTVRAGRAP